MAYAAALVAVGSVLLTTPGGPAAAPRSGDPAAQPRLVSASPITRAEILYRARRWFNSSHRPPYSQSHHWASPSNYWGDGGGDDPSGGWREDCSGFVSQAWGLPGPGDTTFTMPNDSHSISWSSLLPGDALLSQSQEHTALFIGWDDSAHTRFTLWQEGSTATGTNAQSGVSTGDSYWGTFTPTRRDDIAERAQTGDWDGDFEADVSVWRPSTGQWWFHGAATTTTYGVKGDVPVPGDWDGDGRSTDLAVWRPSTGTWYFHGAYATTQYGQAGDIPVPGDYNGNGRTDVAVWRPSTGEWWLRGAAPDVTWGEPGDIPVPGDYDGDGTTDVAVWRPSTGEWYFHGARADIVYGEPGDIPVPGDYNGDGRTDPAVWRPSTGEWYFHGVYPTTVYGEAGDIPVPADYNGDGRFDIAVWRPSTGEWWLRGAAPDDTYGLSGDIPVSSLTLNRMVLRQLGLAH